MADFTDYDKGIDRFLNRFWEKRSDLRITDMDKRERLVDTKQSDTNFPKFTQTIEIPVRYECEVLIVGGGPAGLSAALAAARAGAKTMIIERYGCFGGVITTVGMETLGWYRYEGTDDTEGIGRELERVAETLGAARKWPFNNSPCLDAEQFKAIADDLILENGIRPLLHTLVVDTIVEDNTIKGVIIENKTGRSVVIAGRVVDCSGDADVAYHAGCRYNSVPLEQSMGLTSVFNVAGVDTHRFQEHIEKSPATYKDWSRTWDQETTGKENHLKSPYWDEEFETAVSDGTIPSPDAAVSLGGSWSSLSAAGEATNLNLVHLKGFDPTNAEDLTRAEMLGRKHTSSAITALQRKIPGFEHCKLRNFSMTVGIRDSRKILSRYILTGEDVAMQGRFEDSVGVFPEFIDGYSILILPTTGRYFQVPYGCMVPDVNNLLVAGRCVGGDMVSHAAMRNMMACTVTGQAAGIAAAVSLKEKQSTQDVDISYVQAELRRQGARIQ